MPFLQQIFIQFKLKFTYFVDESLHDKYIVSFTLIFHLHSYYVPMIDLTSTENQKQDLYLLSTPAYVNKHSLMD